MLTLLLVALLCACAYVIFGKSKHKAHELPPPYRGARPIIGHTHLLFTDTTKLWLTIQDTARDAFEKGGVIHEMLGGQIYYMITDAEDAVTAANACLERHFAVKFVKSWLGVGLATAPEDVWKHHRKLINPAFSLPVILRFLDSFNSQAKKLVRHMEPYVGKGPFVSAAHVKKIMLDTFCLSMFGIDSLEDESVTKSYMESADFLMNMTTQRFQMFWLHSNLLYKLSGRKKKEEVEEAILKKMSYNVIEKKKAAMKNNILNDNNDLKTTGIKYRPALDLLLDLFRNGILTEKEISEETNNIIITGFETLAHQFQYALIFLGSNPEAQNKMFEEILQVVGPDRDVDRDDLNQLVYTNAVIMESLRLIPAVPMLMRAVNKDVKLKNYTMRAGSQCILFPLVNRHDPTWGPSGEKFMPERWLGDPELCRKKEFAGFGLGKRGCIGKQYAMVALKVFLVQFIRQYKVTANINRLKLKMDFVVKPVEGNEISIEKRI